MHDCIFCKIIKGEIPSKKVYEDEFVYAFHDINPQAAVHILIVPKTHIASAAEITPDNSALVSKVFEAAAKIAAEAGLDKGYRIVTNVGEHGCQSVKHIHFHLLGGQQLSDKMS
ncbi:MAG: histidine triad nucleotide-binding protein [Clostridia bacterium]|nr:histidine triad nucleotide-binding protein [Clostridia bacterium]